jgi:hypothetical protein
MENANKTPIYTLRAIRAYRERKKDDPIYIAKHKEQSLRYYYKKKSEKEAKAAVETTQ